MFFDGSNLHGRYFTFTDESITVVGDEMSFEEYSDGHIFSEIKILIDFEDNLSFDPGDYYAVVNNVTYDGSKDFTLPIFDNRILQE